MGSEARMEAKEHWENVYSTKSTTSVSWFQEHARTSLDLIHTSGVAREAAILDVGGGASTLVDDLLLDGYTNLSVLDLSSAALAAAAQRIGPAAGKVNWIVADITRADLPKEHFDLWHDRAVFHFLTTSEARSAYVKTVLHAVKPGGHVIIATFAEDGPSQCSGLPVMRYRAEELHAEFGASFTLLQHLKEAHHTPAGNIQQFVYCYFRKTTV